MPTTLDDRRERPGASGAGHRLQPQLAKGHGSRAVSRRRILHGLGAAGLAAGIWQGLRAGTAHAALGATPGSEPATWLRDQRGSWALFTTGPFQSFQLPAGARVGACLIVAGAPATGGDQQLVTEVCALRCVPSGQAQGAIGGLAELRADPGVERCVYRLLGALRTARPASLFGFSGTIDAGGLAGGQDLDLAWEATLRGAHAEAARESLSRYHAWVIGELGPEATFTGHLTYVQVRDVG